MIVLLEIQAPQLWEVLLPFCSASPAFSSRSSQTELYTMALLQFAVQEIALNVPKGHSPEQEFNWMKLLLAGRVL